MTEVPFVFNVCFKMAFSKATQRQSHVCDNIKELRDTLAAQGVTDNTVEFLYVHQVNPLKPNETMEIIAVDNASPGRKPPLLAPVPVDHTKGLVVIAHDSSNVVTLPQPEKKLSAKERKRLRKEQRTKERQERIQNALTGTTASPKQHIKIVANPKQKYIYTYLHYAAEVPENADFG